MFGFLFKDFIYLFVRDTERGRDTDRGRSRLHVRNPMRDSIPGPRGHTLGQGAQPLNHPGAPILYSFLVVKGKRNKVRSSTRSRK